MKISYDEDSDSLYIRLTDKEPDDSFDMDGVIVHLDYWGDICGMEWYENASEHVDLALLDVRGLPKNPGRGGPRSEKEQE